MIRRPPRSTLDRSSAASDVYKRQNLKFIIVGEASRGENGYADTIHKLANSYGLKNLTFTGFRSDTENVLAAIDLSLIHISEPTRPY